MIHSRKPLGLWIMLALAAFVTSGCSIAALFDQTVSGRKVEPRYKPANRPTLVLVDDSQRRLGDPSMRGVAAAHVADILKREGIISTFIDPAEVDRLAQRQGPAFDRMPIDQVGQAVGAQQVIHIHIDSVGMVDSPGIYRPIASLQVRVIDVATHTRLFPSNENTMPNDSGYSMQASLSHRSNPDSRENLEMVLRSKLAQRIGREVARLFFAWDASRTETEE